MDETKPINAKDIIEDPQAVMRLAQQYVMVRDMSMTSRFKDLIEAINIVGEYGWETVSMAVEGATMYAIIRNTNYKRKNQ